MSRRRPRQIDFWLDVLAILCVLAVLSYLVLWGGGCASQRAEEINYSAALAQVEIDDLQAALVRSETKLSAKTRGDQSPAQSGLINLSVGGGAACLALVMVISWQSRRRGRALKSLICSIESWSPATDSELKNAIQRRAIKAGIEDFLHRQVHRWTPGSTSA